MDANICYCDRSLSSCIYCLIAKVNGSGCYGDNVVTRRICTIAAKYCREHGDSTCPLAQAQFHPRLLSRELSLETPRSVGQKHDDRPTCAASETTMLDPPVLVSVSDCVSVVSIGMLPKPTVEGEVEGWPEVVGPPDAHSVVSRTSPYAVTLRKVRHFTASPLWRRAFAAQRGIESTQP